MKSNRTIGRRRLRILLSLTGGVSCAVLMTVVLTVYGPPYVATWWAVMAAILAAAFIVPLFYAHAIDWVIDGYDAADGG